eukprot:251593_1
MSMGCVCVLFCLIAVTFSIDIEWRNAMSKLPIPLTQACVSTTANRTIYIFGGYTTNLAPSRKIYSFDPSTDTLHTLNLSTPTHEFICNNQNTVYSADTNKIYIVGIYTSNADDWTSPYTFNYAFDPLTHQFTSITNAMGDALYPLRQSCVAISGSLIFVYGGFARQYRSSLFVYDILTEQWTQKTNSANKIFNGACYASEDSFYSFGGWNPGQSASWTGGVTNAIVRYDMATDAWYEEGTLSYYKWQMKAVVLNSMEHTVLIMGGYGLDYDTERPNSFKIEAYDYANNVVIPDVGTLSQTQGGSFMVTPYMDGIMVFGGNSYYLQTKYDDIYYVYSYLPTELPSTLVPTDTSHVTLDTSDDNLDTELNVSITSTFVPTNSGSTSSEYTLATNTSFMYVDNSIDDSSFVQQIMANIWVLIVIIVFGVSCVLMTCYLLYKLIKRNKVKHDIQEHNANNQALGVPKQHTVTLTPPGVGGLSISLQKYISVNPDDGDDIETTSTEFDGNVEGVPSGLEGKEEENDLNSDLSTPSDDLDYELKNWLTVNGFAHYLNNFVLHGYDSLDFVKDIQDVQDLIAIGIMREADQH